MRIAVAMAVLVAAACSAPVPPPVASGVGTQATFLLANPAGILALDADCRTIGSIVKLPEQSAPATPALHPSRRSIVFALTLIDPKNGFGSAIHTVNLDGSGLRQILGHEKENVFYASPRLDPTGNILYVHRRAVVIVNGEYKGNEDSIERVDLRTGQRTRLLADAGDPDLSPDGRTLIFVKQKNGEQDGLWVAAADGTSPRRFLTTRDTFWYIQAPRFSPSGRELVFSAAGRSQSGRWTPKGAHLGVPSDLFVAPADGSALKSIGQTGDDVVATWSPDGTRLAYVGTGAFFTLKIADEQPQVCAQGEAFFFGDLLWLR